MQASASKMTTAEHAARESAAALKDTQRELDGVVRDLREHGADAAVEAAAAMAHVQQELEGARADGVEALADVRGQLDAAKAELEASEVMRASEEKDLDDAAREAARSGKELDEERGKRAGRKREFLIDNLLVRIRYIIVMIK